MVLLNTNYLFKIFSLIITIILCTVSLAFHNLDTTILF